MSTHIVNKVIFFSSGRKSTPLFARETRSPTGSVRAQGSRLLSHPTPGIRTLRM